MMFPLAQNVIIRYPSGKWGFAGRVDARLCYVTEDGGTPTPKQLQDAARFGPRLAGVTTRVFATEAAALEALENLK